MGTTNTDATLKHAPALPQVTFVLSPSIPCRRPGTHLARLWVGRVAPIRHAERGQRLAGVGAVGFGVVGEDGAPAGEYPAGGATRQPVAELGTMVTTAAACGRGVPTSCGRAGAKLGQSYGRAGVELWQSWGRAMAKLGQSYGKAGAALDTMVQAQRATTVSRGWGSSVDGRQQGKDGNTCGNTCGEG